MGVAMGHLHRQKKSGSAYQKLARKLGGSNFAKQAIVKNKNLSSQKEQALKENATLSGKNPTTKKQSSKKTDLF